MKEFLTAKQAQFAKPDPSRRVEIAAGPPTGLYLVIHPSGSKSWAFRYRWQGKTRKLTFREGYPDMTLAAARAEAEKKVDELEHGVDPAAVQAEEKIQEEPNSLETVAQEWMDRHVTPNTRPKSRREFQRILNADVLPKWKHKLITDIDRPAVLRLLDGIVDRGAPIVANRTFEVIRGLFNWTVGRGYVVVSPVTGIKPPSAERSRDRVLEPTELLEVWNAADTLGYPLGPFYRFLILTAQRRGEAATMRWDDVDLEKKLWTLPADATKAGRVHDVPLSKAAVKLLKALPRFTKGPFVFTTTSGAKAIGGFSKGKAALDAEILERRKESRQDGETESEDWTVHDLRRTAATHMAKTGVPPHVLAAILNHTPGSTMGVTSIYNRFRYSDERRAALEAWAQYVTGLGKKKAKAKKRAS